jgi:Glycosyl transferases, related to UDP-glucuronosyltransferase
MKIVLATIGSLGDLHPMIALGIELRERGHDIVINTSEIYKEKIEMIGLGFYPLRPAVDPTDRELVAAALDARKGPEKLIKEIIFPHLRDMYEDMTAAVERADLLITGEIVYTAKSVVEKTGIKWISTSLAPLSMFSSYDPNIYPMYDWLEYLRPFPAAFHQALFSFMRWTISDWFEPYRMFRKDLGLAPDHDPIFLEKYSDSLHLAMFSKVLGKPQPDWPQNTLQSGFCFYDGQNDTGQMPDGLENFLDAGEPPIIFTLGSAAVMAAGNFFEESVSAAKALNRRAVLLHSEHNESPGDLGNNIAAFDYAPYSKVFPRAACIVHQGGVGTTGQALRAGVPHLIMPYSHDQPDNAARCRRVGVAEVIGRDKYNGKTAAHALLELLSDQAYKTNAIAVKRIVDSEHGTKTACNAIEQILRK